MSVNDQRTHIDLFSGIGGFALAANAAGYDTRVFCEQDDYCTGVLNRHWPDVPIIPDIRDFDGSKWRGADLLTGGFPCQPFSQAGKQGGTSDDRHLWPEMFRVIKEARPRFVLAENVAGIIKMALDDVLSQLEGEGYTTGTVVLPACSLNAPHRRDRVWIMAHADKPRSQGWQREIMPERAREWSAGASGNQRNIGGQSKSSMGLLADGFPAGLVGGGWWDTEPDTPRVTTGVKDRRRKLMALGNAIVPQVAYEIIRLMDNGD